MLKAPNIRPCHQFWTPWWPFLILQLVWMSVISPPTPTPPPGFRCAAPLYEPLSVCLRVSKNVHFSVPPIVCLSFSPLVSYPTHVLMQFCVFHPLVLFFLLPRCLTVYCQAPQLRHSWNELTLISTFTHTPPPIPRENTIVAISSLWKYPWRLKSVPVPFFHATFVQEKFVHSISVRAKFVHATSVRSIFFHTTFFQGQNLVVYNCNHSCLDQIIKF